MVGRLMDKAGGNRMDRGKRESKRRIQKYSPSELFYPQEGKHDLTDRFTSQDKIKMKGGKSNKASSPRLYNPNLWQHRQASGVFIQDRIWVCFQHQPLVVSGPHQLVLPGSAWVPL